MEHGPTFRGFSLPRDEGDRGAQDPVEALGRHALQLVREGCTFTLDLAGLGLLEPHLLPGGAPDPARSAWAYVNEPPPGQEASLRLKLLIVGGALRDEHDSAHRATLSHRGLREVSQEM